MDKIQNTTGGRISLLLNEKGELQKEFCANLKIHEGVKVSEQTVCSWINNKSTPRIETLKKIAHYFNVDYKYLTCERNYKNFEDMQKKVHDKQELKTLALYNLLEAYGYKIENTGYGCESHNYFNGCRDLDFETYSPIYKIVGPDNEPHYIKSSNLYNLVHDFFLLLNNRLEENDTLFMWDLDFPDLVREISEN